jgi:hypothetical protein
MKSILSTTTIGSTEKFLKNSENSRNNRYILPILTFGSPVRGTFAHRKPVFPSHSGYFGAWERIPAKIR